eukprot:Clim_evm22s159 gene=Clim_evmTU22s159
MTSEDLPRHTDPGRTHQHSDLQAHVEKDGVGVEEHISRHIDRFRINDVVNGIEQIQEQARVQAAETKQTWERIKNQSDSTADVRQVLEEVVTKLGNLDSLVETVLRLGIQQQESTEAGAERGVASVEDSVVPTNVVVGQKNAIAELQRSVCSATSHTTEIASPSKGYVGAAPPGEVADYATRVQVRSLRTANETLQKSAIFLKVLDHESRKQRLGKEQIEVMEELRRRQYMYYAKHTSALWERDWQEHLALDVKDVTERLNARLDYDLPHIDFDNPDEHPRVRAPALDADAQGMMVASWLNQRTMANEIGKRHNEEALLSKQKGILGRLQRISQEEGEIKRMQQGLLKLEEVARSKREEDKAITELSKKPTRGDAPVYDALVGHENFIEAAKEIEDQHIPGEPANVPDASEVAEVIQEEFSAIQNRLKLEDELHFEDVDEAFADFDEFQVL